MFVMPKSSIILNAQLHKIISFFSMQGNLLFYSKTAYKHKVYNKFVLAEQLH